MMQISANFHKVTTNYRNVRKIRHLQPSNEVAHDIKILLTMKNHPNWIKFVNLKFLSEE